MDSRARHKATSPAGRFRLPLAPILLLAATAFLLPLASAAHAKCTGPRYNIRLGTDISIHRESDGAPCVHTVGSSRDPIYGIDVRSSPKHGSLTTVRRLTIVYRPAPGFKGQDSYVFQWVGKLGGTTPSAMTINVSVTVK